MQATVDQLQQMKLTGLLEAWREQQTLPTYHDLSFDERLALMVEREYIHRQNQRLQRRLRQARLPIQATVEAVDFNVPRGLRKMQFLEFAQGHWLTEHLCLILMGPTGVGKSFLASVLAEHLCRQGHTVRYLKTADLILQMNIPAASGRGITSLRSHTSWFDSVQQLPSDAVIRCAASGGESDPTEIEACQGRWLLSQTPETISRLRSIGVR